MKLISKKILACAVGAGLLTFAAGSAQAALGMHRTTSVIDGNLVAPLNAQLIMKYTDANGKVQRATINTKVLVAAISFDFGVNYSGDQIVYWYGDQDYHLMDRNGVLINDVSDEDLTEDGVIVYNYTVDSTSTKNGSNGKFTTVNTGTFDFEFYSDGDNDVVDDELAFVDDSAAFTATETASSIKGGFQSVSITEKTGVTAVGHDFTVDAHANLPVFGLMTQNTSGKVLVANVP